MLIDHDAPKDLGWTADAIKQLDERLEKLEAPAETGEGAEPPSDAETGAD